MGTVRRRLSKQFKREAVRLVTEQEVSVAQTSREVLSSALLVATRELSV